jgi:succinoglycan biosynthesis transport protein ExoP
MLMRPNPRLIGGSSVKSFAGSAASAIDVAKLIEVARRHRVFISITTAIVVGFALLFALTSRPLYSGTAFVIIDSRNARATDSQTTMVTATQLGLDSSAVDSQAEIIKSERIALKVIREWKLASMPEFVQPTNLIVASIMSGLQQVKKVLSFGQTNPDVTTEGIPRAVVDEFAKRLTVKRVEETYVISIRFDAENRALAAGVSNAIANAYLDEELEARFDSVKRTASWMEARIAELRKGVTDSDRAVQEYRRANDIYVTGPGAGVTNGDSQQSQLLSDQRLAKLSDDYASAQRATVEKQSRYDQIQTALKSGDPDVSVVESLNNSVIGNLLAQISGNNVKAAEWSRRYGSTHEAVLRLQYENAQIKQSMIAELQRIAGSYKNDLDVAKSQEANLAASLDSMKEKSYKTSVAQVKLRELQRDADTYKNLYQSFLDRYQTATQQQSFPITDARVLTKASEPFEKTSPKTGLILSLATVAGALLGFGIALAREVADSAFRTPSDVEEQLGMQCLGALPIVSGVPAPVIRDNGDRRLSDNLGILQQTVREPLSRFAETLRSVKVAADLSVSGVPIIGVVSSIPGEGKSTIAMNLAQLISSSGKSVFLIDGDMRNPALSGQVAPARKSGLVDFLIGEASIEQSTYAHPSQPLTFLPANGKIKVSQTAELIGSARMEALLNTARKTYDYVIVDLPPLAPVVDVRAVARMISSFVYVIEWGETSTSTVSQAIQTVPGIETKILGCVLNKTNMNALRLYNKGHGSSEYYDYHRFRQYESSL